MRRSGAGFASVGVARAFTQVELADPAELSPQRVADRAGDERSRCVCAECYGRGAGSRNDADTRAAGWP